MMTPIASSGSGSMPRPARLVLTAVTTITIVTSPALGMPAAPTAARVAVTTTITSSPMPRSMPQSWNMKTTATAS